MFEAALKKAIEMLVGRENMLQAQADNYSWTDNEAEDRMAEIHNVHEVVEALKRGPDGGHNRGRDLTLPVYKHVTSIEGLNKQEAMAFHDNDAVAGTEFREMATLFLQMHDFLCNFAPPSFLPQDPSREAVRIMQARSQALVDKTHNFTRPLRS